MYELVSPGLWRVVIGGRVHWAFSMMEVFFILECIDIGRRAA